MSWQISRISVVDREPWGKLCMEVHQLQLHLRVKNGCVRNVNHDNFAFWTEVNDGQYLLSGSGPSYIRHALKIYQQWMYCWKQQKRLEANFWCWCTPLRTLAVTLQHDDSLGSARHFMSVKSITKWNLWRKSTMTGCIHEGREKCHNVRRSEWYAGMRLPFGAGGGVQSSN